jgi:hypothetical protein
MTAYYVELRYPDDAEKYRPLRECALRWLERFGWLDYPRSLGKVPREEFHRCREELLACGDLLPLFTREQLANVHLRERGLYEILKWQRDSGVRDWGD